MLNSFLSGAVAGFAIAIPVGAISILIFETGLNKGFWAGLAAGSGTASADLIYAGIAATIGGALAVLLTPVALALKWASALFLIGLGMWGLMRTRLGGNSGPGAMPGPRRGLAQTYATLFGLTLLNPTTVAYFAALILGLNIGASLTPVDKMLFVLGAFLASLSWQTLLATVGALAHKHLSPRFQHVTGLVGNLMIIGLGIKILV